jgi:hypothetical protein
MRWSRDNNSNLAGAGLFFIISALLTIPFITSSSLASTNLSQGPNYPIKIDRVTLTDLSGHPLSDCRSAENLVMVAVALENLSTKTVPAAIIIELQDNSGITQFVEWQTMSIGSKATPQMAISFNPSFLKVPSEYTVKVLVWDKISVPKPLGNPTQVPLSC